MLIFVLLIVFIGIYILTWGLIFLSTGFWMAVLSMRNFGNFFTSIWRLEELIPAKPFSCLVTSSVDGEEEREE